MSIAASQARASAATTRGWGSTIEAQAIDIDVLDRGVGARTEVRRHRHVDQHQRIGPLIEHRPQLLIGYQRLFRRSRRHNSLIG